MTVHSCRETLAMPFTRSLYTNMSPDDEQCFNQALSPELSPHSRPMDFFPYTKASETFPANWSYDGAMDLFPLDPVDLNTLGFDFANGVPDADSKDLFMDPFNPSTTIGGLSMPTADDAHSVSSVRAPYPRLSVIECTRLTPSRRNLRVTTSHGR